VAGDHDGRVARKIDEGIASANAVEDGNHERKGCARAVRADPSQTGYAERALEVVEGRVQPASACLMDGPHRSGSRLSSPLQNSPSEH
jgi:hypothetical protein